MEFASLPRKLLLQEKKSSMEFASPPRKLLFQENFSSKKRNHLWNYPSRT
jgi:hypothetical protein